MNRNSGPVRPYIAGCLVGLTLLAQLASFAHLVLVRHRVCPEHGELIHADSADFITLAPSHAREEAGARVRSAPEATAHGHDHCALACSRREQCIALANATAIITPAARACSRWDARRAFTLPARAILALAPKASPPA